MTFDEEAALHASPGPAAAAGAPYADSAEHVFDELQRLDLLLVRALRCQRAGATADVPAHLRGLVIGEEQIESLLARLDFVGDRWKHADALQPALARLDREIDALRARIDARRLATERGGALLSLPTLARHFELSAAEVDVLLLALAVEIDPLYETIYGYLHDDVTRRRPSIGLALQLICRDAREAIFARRLFDADGTLVGRRLVQLGEDPAERPAPLPRQWFKLEDSVAAFLLAPPLRRVAGAALIDTVASRGELEIDAPTRSRIAACTSFLKRTRRTGVVVHLHGTSDSARLGAAEVFARALGRKLLLAAAGAAKSPESLAALRRDALIGGAVLAVRLDEAPAEHDAAQRRAGAAGFWRELAELREPVLLLGADEALSDVPPDVRVWRLAVDAPDYAARRLSWESAARDCAASWDPARLADLFGHGERRIRQVVELASGIAASRDASASAPSFDDVLDAGRTMTSPQLGRFALRIEPRYRWDDLVLPQDRTTQLKQIVAWLRHRRVVHREWGFGDKLSRGKGLVVLFTGPSGTGKTMAAEVLAAELALELFQIDLSSVVSKYIGETERNLSEIFRDAERSQAVLFFDEADALFGKRTEVKDAHDRYANIEVNYLLQRVEQYEGIVVLATNLQTNLDDAFMRRMKQVVEFPFPDETMRERIWRGHFPADAPRADDVDFAFLARQFRFAGGSIKNVVLNAAFQAAEEQAPICMRHVVLAIRSELQKEGKLCVRSDFGPYFDLTLRA
ncbi:MAG TPA: ATP-binding protein [Rhodanobacteraceae bacterium]|nr:ATP-binding protein [Rhodanobacteraceae bacterium]